MAAKKTGKQDDNDNRRRESRPTIQERVAMEKRNEEIRLRLKKSTDRANARELREGLPKTAKAAQRYATDIGKNLNIGKNITLPIKGDVLSGRTPEGGTRSLLEGFRSFVRGGGLRSGGR